MKRVKSFAKIIIALLMALALTTLTACDVLDDFFGKGGEENGTGDGNVYNVTLEPNGGTFTESLPEYYTSGIACDLPANGTKEHYTFDGWYADSSFEGNKVLQIPTGATGDKTYYAKWDPDTYLITYSISGEASTEDTYSYNKVKTLTVPTKNGYTFNGWFASSNLSGDKVTQIAAGEFGVKTFYGEWKSENVSAKKWTVTLHDNGGTYLGTQITEYTEGESATLPLMDKANCDFDGWCENKNLSDNPVFSISSSATGNKEYWAKFTPISADTLQLTAYGGYEEGAYVEFDAVSGLNQNQYSVEYKASNANTYTAIDKELIRVNNGKVRADVVGLKAGSYSLKIIAGTKSATKTVSVSAYDRSGYAHFDSSASDKVYATGVGGYNNDGIPKSGAEIIYVTEANKNSVSGSYLKSSDGVGLVSVLKYSYRSSKPVIIRIIGRIAAPTWEHEDHDHQMIEYTKASSKITSKEIIDQTQSKFGITLSAKSYTQDQLTDLGFKLEKGITPLNGLSSSMTVASDTCWNDCSIGGSSSKAKNVTVEGIGADAVIFQWGMTWKCASSIEIRNLTFTDYTEDACSFEGGTSATSVDNFDSQRIWVHNCTFNRGKSYWDLTDEQDKHDGDGATDFKRAAYITVAYNNYYNNHKTGLIGSDDNVTTANVTFHHNFYEICESRLPLARQANMHMYNNYYYGSTGTNMSIRSGAYAFVEACYFENAANPIVTQLGKEDKLLSGYGRLDGYAKAYNCTFTGKQVDTKNYNVTITSSRNATVKNDNIFDDQFDLDSNKFYLNSYGATKVTLLTDASQARFDCVNYAGAHKPSGYVMIATESTLKAYHDSRKIK